jgi:hypothetical protein
MTRLLAATVVVCAAILATACDCTGEHALKQDQASYQRLLAQELPHGATRNDVLDFLRRYNLHVAGDPLTAPSRLLK